MLGGEDLHSSYTPGQGVLAGCRARLNSTEAANGPDHVVSLILPLLAPILAVIAGV